MNTVDVSNQVLLTKKGLEQLRNELADLRARRPEVVARVDEARSLGDLSENEAYRAARREQAFLDGRIDELKDLLSRAKTITSSPNSNGEVGLGSKIKVKVDSQEQEFTLVDENEADSLSGKLSHTSPIGRALLGKKQGDRVEVEAPIGKVVYTILKVE